jgi:histidinol-phosphate/aromatic aminotransferase/cobyric acid decarboxylase-like protein
LTCRRHCAASKPCRRARRRRCNTARPKATTRCANSWPPSWPAKGAKRGADEGLIVTTGSQQALDLLGKTMISPGDKVIVEGPTFLATIQCFRLYGANSSARPSMPMA